MLFKLDAHGHIKAAPMLLESFKSWRKTVMLKKPFKVCITNSRQGVFNSHRASSALWNVPQTQRNYHSGPSMDIGHFNNITDFIFQNASKYAKDIALTDTVTGRSVTYQQLQEDVDHVTQHLHALGVTEGQVVTIHGSNSPHFIHVLCACANLGAITSLAGPQLTVGELVTQARLSSTTLVMTSQDVSHVARQACQDLGLPPPFVFGEAPGCRPFSTLTLRPQRLVSIPAVNRAPCTALLPFSSGTTGLPKGVMLTHRNLVAQLTALSHPSYLPMQGGHVSALCLPMAHIAGLVICALNPLAQGAQVAIMPRYSLSGMCHTIEAYRATFCLVAPPIMTQLAKDDMALKYDLSSLHSLFCGSAALDASLTDAVAARLSLGGIRQGYGMTEASPATHMSPLEGWSHGSVGVPLPNTDSKVVDHQGREVAAGVTGELWLRGPQVMAGYLGNEAATREAMVGGWLRTGDLGYYDDKGQYFIVDRLKDIINYKGYQVSPTALEAVLLEHAAVREAAVVGVADEAAGELPVAWVTLRATCEPRELEAWVAERVAAYKRLRGGVRVVEDIPKSGSGKILRRVIRQMEQSIRTKGGSV